MIIDEHNVLNWVTSLNYKNFRTNITTTLTDNGTNLMGVFFFFLQYSLKGIPHTLTINFGIPTVFIYSLITKLQTL